MITNRILRGYDTRRADVAYLVTSGARQTRPLAEVRRELAYAFPGLKPSGYVDEIDGIQFLAEETPRGGQLDDLDRPLPPEMVARLIVEIAALVESAHAKGVTLYGVRPELVWADGWMIDRSLAA